MVNSVRFHLSVAHAQSGLRLAVEPRGESRMTRRVGGYHSREENLCLEVERPISISALFQSPQGNSEAFRQILEGQIACLCYSA